ncbi:MAG: serine/threonine protein kinase [Deltaproteobacteria bacterium]|nr:serine/threonine protein kinase [Deltaproteobacteria bacterium]
MARVCPSCDRVPDPSSEAAASCAGCGAPLLFVEDRDPLVGTILDNRFELRERLGAGAMGVVYRATQLSIGRDVAVKVMTRLDAIAVKRFFREAQIASALSHPNTVQIIEFGQGADGRVYLAMELVRGRTLLDEIKAGLLPADRICRIGVQLCEALEAAHRMTIVHRDLKPENIMLSTDGTDHVKILDFGIARVLGGDPNSQLTGAGMAAGTPNYMAPEVLGQAAEPASAQDMYALGVILAELALGRSLWTSSSLQMLLVAKVSNQNLEDVPVPFRTLVQRLIDPSPDQRPGAAEVRRLLRELDRGAPDPRPEPPPADLSFPDVMELVDVGGSSPADPAPLTLAPPDRTPPPEPLDLQLDDERATQRVAHAALARAERSLPASLTPEGTAGGASSRRIYGALIVLVLLGGGAGIAYYAATRPTVASATPTSSLPEQLAQPVPPVGLTPTVNGAAQDRKRGITIRIVGAPGTAITIDGRAAGRTPLSLERSAGKRTMTIQAPGFVTRVIPDHDQTIDVTTGD